MTSQATDPEELLKEGAEILLWTLQPCGFTFRIRRRGSGGSGGASAEGWFISGNKRLELHFRWSLGLVTYHVGNRRLGHEDYMRSLRVRHEAAYPGFSEQPLAAFEHLSSDLTRYCQDFLLGEGKEVARFADEIAANPAKFKGLP